jgi:hypothetical protein
MPVLTGLSTQSTSTVKPVVLLPLVRSPEVTKRVTDTTTLQVPEEELPGRSKTLLLFADTVNFSAFIETVLCIFMHSIYTFKKANKLFNLKIKSKEKKKKTKRKMKKYISIYYD